MDRSRMELEPGLWLDARRAVWLEKSGVLAVADLHLGYAWAHRAAGQLLPLGATGDSTTRLLELLDIYRPAEMILLGDVVHRAIPAPALLEELRRLVGELSARTELRILAGNHDSRLALLLQDAGLPPEISLRLEREQHLLLHGDSLDGPTAAAQLQILATRQGRLIMGHEHPTINLSDGVATSVKCPCFLISPQVLVLPAFSHWAAGSSVHGPHLSSYARLTPFDRAIAIVAGKLLPVKLPR